GTDTRAFGDVLEAPATEIPVERTASFRARKKNVDETVAVDVSERHAGALTEDAVAQERRIADRVLELNARALAVHASEAGLPGGDLQLTPPIACLLVPGRSRRRSARGAGSGECERDDRDGAAHANRQSLAVIERLTHNAGAVLGLRVPALWASRSPWLRTVSGRCFFECASSSSPASSLPRGSLPPRLHAWRSGALLRVARAARRPP